MNSLFTMLSKHYGTYLIFFIRYIYFFQIHKFALLEAFVKCFFPYHEVSILHDVYEIFPQKNHLNHGFFNSTFPMIKTSSRKV